MATLKTPSKYTREQLIEHLREKEPGIDFTDDVHKLSHSELSILAAYAPLLLRFRHKPDYPGSLGREVFEFLARWKEQVYVIYGDYGNGKEFLTLEKFRINATNNLKAYREANPGKTHWMVPKQLNLRQQKAL